MLYYYAPGGGGAFGCVTSFTFRLHEQRPTVAATMAFYPGDHTEVLMPKIRKWLEVCSSLRAVTSRCQESLTLSRTRLMQVRTPEENGYIVYVVHEGNPVMIFGCTYNGPAEEGQKKFADILESEYVAAESATVYLWRAEPGISGPTAAMMGNELKDIPYENMNRMLDAFLKPGAHAYANSATVRAPSDELLGRLHALWTDACQQTEKLPKVIYSVEFHNWTAAAKVDPHATPFFRRDTDVSLTSLTLPHRRADTDIVVPSSD